MILISFASVSLAFAAFLAAMFFLNLPRFRAEATARNLKFRPVARPEVTLPLGGSSKARGGRAWDLARNPPRPEAGRPSQREGDLERTELTVSGTSDQSAENCYPVSISVLIPARDEAGSIGQCVRAALGCVGVDVEVIVLDDASQDNTAAIVAEMASNDSRVRCIRSEPLPENWNGKQHACWQLSQAARLDHWLFLDADVRLASHSLAFLIRQKQTRGVALLSAFPHQETGTLLEKMLVPMMHYVLLCFLPFGRMRSSVHPAYAAGCGQMFLTTKAEYLASGTHQAIKQSRHDGIKLPGVYRTEGLMTDVIDGTSLAECRMYRSARQVVMGVLKNATEGIAHPRRIIPFSVLLLGANVVPLVTFSAGVMQGEQIVASVSLFAILIAHLPRAVAAIYFQQSFLGVVLHSIATLLFVALQWTALVLAFAGKQVTWRGRRDAG